MVRVDQTCYADTHTHARKNWWLFARSPNVGIRWNTILFKWQFRYCLANGQLKFRINSWFENIRKWIFFVTRWLKKRNPYHGYRNLTISCFMLQLGISRGVPLRIPVVVYAWLTLSTVWNHSFVQRKMNFIEYAISFNVYT